MQQLAGLYERHDREAGQIQKFADGVTAALGRPAALAVVCAFMIVWIAGNLLATMCGWGSFDRFPFPELEFISTIAALLVALLILTTQRHEDELAGKRAHLTLQIAILSEKKIAKLIGLVEEQRRDNPLLPSRSDAEATEMAAATDPLVQSEEAK